MYLINLSAPQFPDKNYDTTVFIDIKPDWLNYIGILIGENENVPRAMNLRIIKNNFVKYQL